MNKHAPQVGLQQEPIIPDHRMYITPDGPCWLSRWMSYSHSLSVSVRLMLGGPHLMLGTCSAALFPSATAVWFTVQCVAASAVTCYFAANAGMHKSSVCSDTVRSMWWSLHCSWPGRVGRGKGTRQTNRSDQAASVVSMTMIYPDYSFLRCGGMTCCRPTGKRLSTPTTSHNRAV
jgi:hypothetical protein